MSKKKTKTKSNKLKKKNQKDAIKKTPSLILSMKKTKTSKPKKKSQKASTNKTVVAILSIIFIITGSVFAFINVFVKSNNLIAISIFVFWFIGLALAFNSQKSSIKWNRTVGMVGVGIMALSFLVFLVYNQVIANSEGATNLRNCKYNLLRLAGAIKEYKSDNSEHCPQNLKILSEQGYLDKYFEGVLKCPLNENHYSFEISGWEATHFTIRCPNEPIKHVGRLDPKDEITTELYYSSRLEKIVEETKPKIP
ncbi:hypothetical protein KAU33_15140 [Candidatus Dependentiae bacterium]|nr:hypothetical protein [Candidatus Dependentiae bacterium]